MVNILFRYKHTFIRRTYETIVHRRKKFIMLRLWITYMFDSIIELLMTNWYLTTKRFIISQEPSSANISNENAFNQEMSNHYVRIEKKTSCGKFWHIKENPWSLAFIQIYWFETLARAISIFSHTHQIILQKIWNLCYLFLRNNKFNRNPLLSVKNDKKISYAQWLYHILKGVW